MNSAEIAKDQRSAKKKDESSADDNFDLVIANLSQIEDAEKDANQQSPLAQQEDNLNIESKMSSPGSSTHRIFPKNKQYASSDDASPFKTPRKKSHVRTIFETPEKSKNTSSQSSISSSAQKVRHRKVFHRKRLLSSEDDDDDGKSMQKSPKVEHKSGTRDDEDIDEALDLKAGKIKMNAKNVKTVIRHVLTNQSVLNMFKDVLEVEPADSPTNVSPSKSEQLEFEPKITRAKVKDFLERISVASPSKKPAPGPSILDVDFAEEEEDDEYDPAKDECHESGDDETESMVSSRFSDFGSPCPRTPTTPAQVHDKKNLFRETSDVDVDNLHSQSHNTSDIVDATAQGDVDKVNTIALRTRSKLPLHSTSITDIENAFVAPDITPDMYYTNDDADWNQFLSTLYKPTDDAGTDDDGEANDPEFDYLAEAELEEDDAEEVQFNKPTKISKKELKALMGEIDEIFKDEVLPHQMMSNFYDPQSQMNQQEQQQQQQPLPANDQLPIFKTPLAPKTLFDHEKRRQPEHSGVDVQTQQSPRVEQHKSFQAVQYQHSPGAEPSQTSLTQQQQSSQTEQQRSSQTEQQQSSRAEQGHPSVYESHQETECIFSQHHMELVKDQMRKHVQLLAQSFVIFQSDMHGTRTRNGPKFLLNELDHLRQTSCAGDGSLFNVCNLQPALAFVSDQDVAESECEENSLRQRPGRAQFKVTAAQKRAIYNSPAFVYPHLLPTFKLVRKTQKHSPFLPSEDNLIALGLEQFRDCRNVHPSKLIQTHLVFRQDEKRIKYRISWLVKSGARDNAVRFVYKNRRLPDDFPKSSVTEFSPIAPRDHDPSLLPKWCSRNSTRSSGEFEAAADPHKQDENDTDTSSDDQTLPDPSKEKYPSSMPNLPCTSTPQNDNVPSFHSVSFISTPVSQGSTSILPSASAERTLAYSSQHVQHAPALPGGLKHQAGQVIVFPRPSNNALPITGIFYPLGNSEAMSQSTELTQLASHRKRCESCAVLKKTSSNSSTRLRCFRKVDSTMRLATPSKSNTTSIPGLEAPSPDLLTKTMLSCGIGEEMSNLSAITPTNSPAAQSPDPVRHERVNPSVRNLRKAFDAVRGNTRRQASQSCDKTSSIQTDSGKNQVDENSISFSPSVMSAGGSLSNSLLTSPSFSQENDSSLKQKIRTSSSKTISILRIKGFESPSIDPHQTLSGGSFHDKNKEHSMQSVPHQNPQKQSVSTHGAPVSPQSAQTLISPLKLNPLASNQQLNKSRNDKQLTLLPPQSAQTLISPLKDNLVASNQQLNKSRNDKQLTLLPAKSLSKAVSGARMENLNKENDLVENKNGDSNNSAAEEMDQTDDTTNSTPFTLLAEQNVLASEKPLSKISPSSKLSEEAVIVSDDSQEKTFTGVADEFRITSKESVEDCRKDTSEESVEDCRKGTSEESVEDCRKGTSEESVEDCRKDTSDDFILSPGMMEEELDVDQAEIDEIMDSIVTIRFKTHEQKSDEDEDATMNDNEPKITAEAKEMAETNPEDDIWHSDEITLYFQKVRELFENRFHRLKQCLFVLHKVNTNRGSTVELYIDLILMLHDHRDLVNDFAGLVLSFQAILCGCSVSENEFESINKFLSKLKSTCNSSFVAHHHTLTALQKWLSTTRMSQLDRSALKEKIMTLLYTVPGLVDELCRYFLCKQICKRKLSGSQEKDTVEGEGTSEYVKLRPTEPKHDNRVVQSETHFVEKDGRLERETKVNLSVAKNHQSTSTVSEPAAFDYEDNLKEMTTVFADERKKLKKTKFNAANQSISKAKKMQQKKNNKGRGLSQEIKRKKKFLLGSKESKHVHDFNRGVSDFVEERNLLEKAVLRTNHHQDTCSVGISTSSSNDTGFSKPSPSSSDSILPQACTTSPVTNNKSSVSAISKNVSVVLHSSNINIEQNTPLNSKAPESSDLGPLAQDCSAAITNLASVTDSTNSTSLQPVVCAGNSLSSVAKHNSFCDSSKAILEHPLQPAFQSTPRYISPSCNISPFQSITSRYQPTSTPQIRVPVVVYLRPQKMSSSQNINNTTLRPSSLPEISKVLPKKLDSSRSGSFTETNPEDLYTNVKSQKTSTVKCALPIVQMSNGKGFASPQDVKKAETGLCSPKTKATVKSKKVTPKQRTSILISPRKITRKKTSRKASQSNTKSSYCEQEVSINTENNSDGHKLKGTEEKIVSIPVNQSSELARDNYISLSSKSLPLGNNQSLKTPPLSSESVALVRTIETSNISSKTCNIHVPHTPSETANGNINLSQKDMCSTNEDSVNLRNKNLFQTPTNSDIEPNGSNSLLIPPGQSVNPEIHPSETLSHLSPLKLNNRKPTEVFQHYLETLSLGPLDEATDPHLFQRIAHLLTSPHKQNTDSVSKFDLLAFIESSQFASKDLAASRFFNQNSVSTKGPLGFSQALREQGLVKSDSEEPIKLKDEDSPRVGDAGSRSQTEIAGLFQSAGETENRKPIPDNCEGQQSNDGLEHDEENHGRSEKSEISPSSNGLCSDPPEDGHSSQWTEEWDTQILQAVVENDGVSESFVNMIHLQIPQKSVDELKSRAQQLLEMI